MSVGSFLADPAFPQLGIASDSGLMKETFRTYLRPAGKVYDIEDRRLTRLRCRQDSRCFLQYTLRLLEPDRRQRPRTAAREFAEEYFARVPRTRGATGFPSTTPAPSRRYPSAFFGRQEPDWPGRIATLLEEAKAFLAGRIW